MPQQRTCEMVKELTDGQLAKQAHRLLELVRRDRIRIVTGDGMVPVRNVSIIREDDKPTVVVAVRDDSAPDALAPADTRFRDLSNSQEKGLVRPGNVSFDETYAD